MVTIIEKMELKSLNYGTVKSKLLAEDEKGNTEKKRRSKTEIQRGADVNMFMVMIVSYGVS